MPCTEARQAATVTSIMTRVSPYVTSMSGRPVLAALGRLP